MKPICTSSLLHTHLAILSTCSALLGCADGAGDENWNDLASTQDELRLTTYACGDSVCSSTWSSTDKRDLSFCVSPTGWPSTTFRAFITSTYNSAATSWNQAADVNIYNVSASPCDNTNSSVKFNIRYDGTLSAGSAVSFRPHFPRAQREIRIGPQKSGNDYYWYQARHELGHALGFANETDTHPVAILNGPDPDSAMQPSGTETALSELDRQGAQSVYGIRWLNLGGEIAGSPTAASWGSGRLDIFARGLGSPDRIHQRWFDGAWHPWSNLGAPSVGLGGSPNAVGRAVGKLDVFVRGSDTALWRRTYDNAWGPWVSEGGSIAGRPGVASWAANRWDVLVVGGGSLHHKWYDGSSHPFQNWGHPTETTLHGDVSAVSWGANRLDALVRGTNLRLFHFAYDGGTITWTSVPHPPATLDGAPTLVKTGVGQLEAFALAAAGRLYMSSYRNGAWSAWSYKGNLQADKVGAVSWGPGRIDVFSRRSYSSALHQAYSVNGSWY